MANHPNRSPRHGHLPGHIRATFQAVLDAFAEGELLVMHEIAYRERRISLAEACRLVWHCTTSFRLPSVVSWAICRARRKD